MRSKSYWVRFGLELDGNLQLLILELFWKPAIWRYSFPVVFRSERQTKLVNRVESSKSDVSPASIEVAYTAKGRQPAKVTVKVAGIYTCPGPRVVE